MARHWLSSLPLQFALDSVWYVVRFLSIGLALPAEYRVWCLLCPALALSNSYVRPEMHSNWCTPSPMQDVRVEGMFCCEPHFKASVPARYFTESPFGGCWWWSF
jgi:hypothetical protein